MFLTMLKGQICVLNPLELIQSWQWQEKFEMTLGDPLTLRTFFLLFLIDSAFLTKILLARGVARTPQKI